MPFSDKKAKIAGEILHVKFQKFIRDRLGRGPPSPALLPTPMLWLSATPQYFPRVYMHKRGSRRAGRNGPSRIMGKTK